MIRVLLFFPALLGLVACSVSFPQAEAIISLVRKPATVDDALAPYRWELTWLGDVIPVYAVAVPGATVFANADEVLVVYADGFVSKASGFLPYGREATVERDGEDFLMSINGSRAEIVRCQPWTSAEVENGGVLRLQTCPELRSPNRESLNGSGEIRRLVFSIHPDYPPLELVKVQEGPES